jgi:hypothetical protein
MCFKRPESVSALDALGAPPRACHCTCRADAEPSMSDVVHALQEGRM